MNKYLSSKIRIISFICIIMVVFLHCYNFTDNFLQPNTTITEGLNYATFIELFLCNGFSRVAVPIFFIISGYLFFLTYKLSSSGYFYKIKTRFISLIIPYIIWSLLGILACVLLGNLNVMPINDMKTNFSSGGVLAILWNPPSFQFWFIKQLFIFTLISPVIYLLVRYKYSSVSYFIALFIIWFLEVPSISLILWEALVFYSIGAYLAVHEKSKIILVKINKNNIIFISAIWVILLAVKTVIAGLMAPTDNTFILVVLHKISIFIGIFAIWYGMDYLLENTENKEKLSKLSIHTFFIYCFHEPLLDIVIQYTLVYINNSALVNVITYFAYPIITIILAILLSNVLLKIIPGLRNILIGNRKVKVEASV